MHLSSNNAEWERLLSIAKKVISNTNCPKLSQAIVIRTKCGNIYSFFTQLSDYEQAEVQILQHLAAKQDTSISMLLAMWENGTLDVPSQSLRRKLIDLDPANTEALLLLRGQEQPICRAIGSTM